MPSLPRWFVVIESVLCRTIVLAPWIVSAGCYPQLHAGPENAAPPPVEVLELQTQPIAETATLIGTTEPWREAALHFEVSGIVSEVFVEEGQLVEPQTPIARLDPRDYELALSRTQAELAAAQARLDLLTAGTRKEDVAAAEADHARARSLAEFWKGEWDRVGRLNAISLSERERARAQYDAALQEEQAMRARWEKAVAGFRAEEIAEAQAQTAALQQAVARAQRDLDKATLRAPFRGRIEKRYLDPGAYINQFPTGGVAAVQVVDLDQIDVLFDVSETLLAHCRAGAVLNVASAADPQATGRARIISIGGVADRLSGTYALRARLDNPEHRFGGGMVVTAELPKSSPGVGIRIPLSAVCRAHGEPPYVLVVDRETNRAVARPVHLGPVAGDAIHVLDGLSASELLVVRGEDQIQAGDLVARRAAGIRRSPEQ
jgi:HlyD family secretion protein